MVIIGKSLFRAITRVLGLSSTKRTSQELTLDSPFQLFQEDEARYRCAIGLNGGTTTPIEPIHLVILLSAVTEPAMLLLLTSRICPISPLGAVNVRNRFELLRPDLCNLSSFRAPNRAILSARVHSEPRSVKRGLEYDLEVSILVPNDDGEGNVSVFRQVFTMLEFGKVEVSRAEGQSRDKKTSVEERQSSELAVHMSFSSSDPLRWAALCKDYNLIHLSGIAARLFGLPGKLAHGNHVVAKALRSLLETRSIQSKDNAPAWMEVHFKRPVVVPAKLHVESFLNSATTTGFAITHNGRSCVTAEYGIL
ncbi:uncharacterized protein K460DRAFT_332458 [Cucurbitaria berberidis CBS 394.84]|uniref:MaoC-like domain-containing protein n=1 Tax=Cucurbitaria berberidis CBS 394.84 TaxID=1168544 RepID=A0A9P4GJL3_9PLEO|nr:uncharacterized protein K460DRAFT_332458 [Cucurbitaria berberidis CBS 394.84]KAF1847458.1 hypothetical protein K460DRAFT_332458 [Cucurbitaria berberidis CBS 394.84]